MSKNKRYFWSSMGDVQFPNWLVEQKKKRFLDAVERAASALGVTPPPVNFYEDSCPYDTGREWAHIHLDTGVICVSELRLKQMTYEKIEETATHEVAHLVDASHDPSFRKVHTDLKVASWRPPSGVSFVRGNSKPEPIKPVKARRKTTPNSTRCNYHLCRKKTQTHKCKHCSGYFCNEHLSPYVPRMPNFESRSRIQELEWNEEGGHPCPPFFNYSQQKKRDEIDRYRDTLNVLSGRPAYEHVKKNESIRYEPSDTPEPIEQNSVKVTTPTDSSEQDRVKTTIRADSFAVSLLALKKFALVLAIFMVLTGIYIVLPYLSTPQGSQTPTTFPSVIGLSSPTPSLATTPMARVCNSTGGCWDVPASSISPSPSQVPLLSCPNYVSCLTCTSNPNCGWSKGQNKCKEGTDTTSLDRTSLGSDWLASSWQCPGATFPDFYYNQTPVPSFHTRAS